MCAWVQVRDMILLEVQRMERVRALIAEPQSPEYDIAQRAYVQLAQVSRGRHRRAAVAQVSRHR